MNKKIIITLLFTLLTSTSEAFACRPVQNRAEDLPVYDQGPTGLCYAFTAAQMFDVWRKDSGKKSPP